jgi:hypothetical protein
MLKQGLSGYGPGVRVKELWARASCFDDWQLDGTRVQSG